MPDDPAHLHYIKPQVDDQVTGEHMAKIVKPKRRPAVIVKPGAFGGAGQAASGDVSMSTGRAARGSEYPVGCGGERRCELVRGEQPGELRDERDVPARGRGLRGHAPSPLAAVGAGELRADMDHARGKVNVVPHEAEQLGDPQTGVEGGRDYKPVAWRARCEQPLNLASSQHALAPAGWSWSLMGFQLLDRIGRDPAVAARVADDAVQRCERACR